ncbi:DUF551 domain-containing protein [Klebsiella aerogenes]
MTKSTITRERIQRIIRAIDSESYDEEEIREWLSSDEIMELARMALAAMGSEPVAWRLADSPESSVTVTDNEKMAAIWRRNGRNVQPLYSTSHSSTDAVGMVVSEGRQPSAHNPESKIFEVLAESGYEPVPGDKLYRHAQPVPVPAKPVGFINPAREPVLYGEHIGIAIGAQLYAVPQPAPVVPVEMNSDKAWGELKISAEDCQAWSEGWNACRAAMLQAEPVTTANKLGNSPVIQDTWIPVSERLPPSRHEVLVGCWWGEKPRWCCKWATYIPGHPDAQSSGWLIPGASWTPTHWMLLPAAPQEVKGE